MRPLSLDMFHTDEEELQARRDFMSGEGYRICSIPACNCNSWHGGNASNRLRDLRDIFAEFGVDTNGVTLLDTVKKLAVEAGYTNDI